jgi:hypothetical protein
MPSLRPDAASRAADGRATPPGVPEQAVLRRTAQIQMHPGEIQSRQMRTQKPWASRPMMKLKY